MLGLTPKKDLRETAPMFLELSPASQGHPGFLSRKFLFG